MILHDRLCYKDHALYLGGSRLLLGVLVQQLAHIPHNRLNVCVSDVLYL